MHDEALYRQELLQHYRNPQNFGRLKKATESVYRVNPLCGDEMDMAVLLNRNGAIADIRFSGAGCALSIASASLLTELVRGKTLEAVKKMNPGRALSLLPIPISAARRKCALLAYEALKDIVGQHEQKRNSEKNRRNPRS